MTDPQRARKPERNPSHIVFPKKGAPYPVVEQLPREQKDLELSIGRKFLGALARFENMQLGGLTRGTEPGDLTCSRHDGTEIHVQVVEVINQHLRQLRHMRSSYQDALLEELGDVLRFFRGCKVSLVDTSDPPYLPPVDSKHGRHCLLLLAEQIRQLGEEMHTLEPGKIRNRIIRTTHPVRSVFVQVERFVPGGQDVPFQFLWTGGGPCSPGLLPSAVTSKIEKRYAKPASAQFWMLAYSVDTSLMKDDPDIAASQRLLEASAHPFDYVWFFFPYAGQDLGALIHVWPERRDDSNHNREQ